MAAVVVTLGQHQWNTTVEIDGRKVFPLAFAIRFEPSGKRVIDLTLADVEIVPAPDR